MTFVWRYNESTGLWEGLQPMDGGWFYVETFATETECIEFGQGLLEIFLPIED